MDDTFMTVAFDGDRDAVGLLVSIVLNRKINISYVQTQKCKFRFSGTLISLSPEHLLRENGTPNSEKWNACFFYFKMV